MIFIVLKRYLVPVDGSDNSHRALDAALLLSEKLGAKVIAVHVMEDIPILQSKTGYQITLISHTHSYCYPQFFIGPSSICALPIFQNQFDRN